MLGYVCANPNAAKVQFSPMSMSGYKRLIRTACGSKHRSVACPNGLQRSISNKGAKILPMTSDHVLSYSKYLLGSLGLQIGGLYGSGRRMRT
jgi:hypothetical protein